MTVLQEVTGNLEKALDQEETNCLENPAHDHEVISWSESLAALVGNKTSASLLAVHLRGKSAVETRITNPQEKQLLAGMMNGAQVQHILDCP